MIIDGNKCKEGCTLCDYFCPMDIIYQISQKETLVVKYKDER
jgi:Pyruvate/2-oxoacid:ferredoxin oxidoreductase delta subunit